MNSFKITETLEISDSEFVETAIRKTAKMKIYDRSIMVIAEFIGTAMLVFFGCMGCIEWTGWNSLISAPLNFGLVVMLLTQVFGHLSYAVFNPSVTIAATICRIIDFKLGIIYFVTQLAGATVGYGLLKGLAHQKFAEIPEDKPGICITQLNESITSVEAFCIEFFLTSALILISCSHWDPRNKHLVDSVPLRMGLAVAALGITGGRLTGASMNPARTFGPALWNWQWENQWIYWLAPLSSGFFSSILYKLLFWDQNPKKSAC